MKCFTRGALVTRTSFNKNIFANWYFIRLSEISEKLAEQRHFAAIRRGLLLCMPLTVIGSFANLFVNLPLPVYQQSMIRFFGLEWSIIGNAISNATFGIMSVLLVLSVSYFLAETSNAGKESAIHPQMAAITALACLIALIQPISSEGTMGIAFTWLGVLGLLLAMVTAVAATEILLYLKSIKMLTISIFSDEADPVISQAVAGLLPAGLTLLFFAFIKFGFVKSGVMDIHQLVYNLIKTPFLEMPNTMGTAVIYNAMIQLLWFFGIHGHNVLSAINQGLYTPAGNSNTALYLIGQQPTEVFTTGFMAAFATVGGTGSTLCLIIAILLVTRKGNSAWLAKLSILPGIFNINELLVFGLPIVLNPIYLIPFLLTPIITTMVAYYATAFDFVPVTSGVFSWTTPVFLSGYLATHSFNGAVLQFINILLGVAIYLPFVWLAKIQKALKMNRALDTLCKLAFSNDIKQNMLTRRDTVGNLFRVLAYDLKEALNNEELILKYQPQIDQHEKVTGVEALLRWQHKAFGYLPPPLIIAIAEEAGLIHSLGKWVIDTAAAQLKLWQDKQVDVIMSVNVSATQFYKGDLLGYISEAIRRNGINTSFLEIEITESIAMNDDIKTKNILQSLHDMGVRIAIDDFGMGHSSLNYIKNFPVDTLKIDKSLSIDIAQEKNSREIVSSIITLCTSLHIKTIVEYVETNEQRDILKALGSVHYQGYLYSPAISSEQALAYILKLNYRH